MCKKSVKKAVSHVVQMNTFRSNGLYYGVWTLNNSVYMIISISDKSRIWFQFNISDYFSFFVLRIFMYVEGCLKWRMVCKRVLMELHK